MPLTPKTVALATSAFALLALAVLVPRASANEDEEQEAPIEQSCGPSEAERIAMAAIEAGEPPPPMDYDAMTQVESLATALHYMKADMRLRTSMEQEAIRDASDHIVKTCPYRRAGVQLVVTMHLEIDRLNDAGQGFAELPEVSALRAQLARLHDAVALHEGYMHGIGVAKLPEPADDDYLGRHRPDAAIMTAVSLEESSDRLDATGRAIASIDVLVPRMDDATSTRLNATSASLEHDGGLFFMKGATVGYRGELVDLDRIATELRHDARTGSVELSRELLDYLEDVELTALRLSQLAGQLGRRGC